MLNRILKANTSDKFFYLALALIFILGIALRLNVYFLNKSLWGDEAALALNIMDKNFLDLFIKPLDFSQCAPYLFIAVSKITTSVFGESEYVFRLFPLISGLVSIFAFYFLSKEMLNKKWTVLAANYLFCVNYQLIYYSQEFKQYSVEVLVTILTLIFLSKLDIKSLSYKKCFILGLAFFILFLFSMPEVFILTAFAIYLFFKSSEDFSKKIKRIFFLLLPFGLLLIPYYFMFLSPNRKMMLDNLYMWQERYFSLNFFYLKSTLNDLFFYFFHPVTNLFLSLALLFSGAFLVCRDKKHTGMIILILLLFACFLSFVHIYPLYKRLALYLIPLLILLMTKPLDAIVFPLNNENFSYKSLFLSILIVAVFIFQFKVQAIKHVFRLTDEANFSRGSAREFLETVIRKDGSDARLIFTESNMNVLDFYMKRSNFTPKELLCYPMKSYNDDKKVFDKLERGKTYWFYLYSATKSEGCVVDYFYTMVKDKNPEILFKEEISPKNRITGGYLVQFRLP